MKTIGIGVIALFALLGCAANLTDPAASAQSSGTVETSAASPAPGSQLEASGTPAPAPSVPAGCVPPSPLPADTEYVPGEVLFKFKQPPTDSELEAAKAHFGLTATSQLGGLGIYKGSFTGSVPQMIVDMICDGRFEFAEPNGIIRIDPRETNGGLSTP